MLPSRSFSLHDPANHDEPGSDMRAMFLDVLKAANNNAVERLWHFCEAQGKGRARGGPRKVTQRSFIDGGCWMVDILSLMLYIKVGCHPPPPPPTTRTFNFT